MPPSHEATKASCRTGTGMPADDSAAHVSRLPRQAITPGGPELAPGRPFGDLLPFAKAHHPPVHGSVITDLLRRGFGPHVRCDVRGPTRSGRIGNEP
jgi:hypothetical protein